MSSPQTATIETKIPSRLDRLPWSRFHWLIVIGLGTVWILDGLEVTLVGSIASRLTESGSGIDISTGQIGTAAAIYVAGACSGALFFGQLTDRFGRKKLFLITLAIYLVATGATAFAFAPWYFYVARFFTGAGIGGEYAAINSAIDELIPARVRGRVDLIINGSYWVGSAAGSAAALIFLDTAIFAADLGWRLAFGMGVVLGFAILLVRRHVPESPRWLFIHGREEEAERIVSDIEEDVEEETGQELPEPDDSITVRQRETIPFRTIGRTAFKVYPRRAVLGLALFVGQAFIYNGVTFNLGTLFTTFYDVTSSFVPVFIIIFAIGNFLGPLTLGGSRAGARLRRARGRADRGARRRGARTPGAGHRGGRTRTSPRAACARRGRREPRRGRQGRRRRARPPGRGERGAGPGRRGAPRRGSAARRGRAARRRAGGRGGRPRAPPAGGRTRPPHARAHRPFARRPAPAPARARQRVGLSRHGVPPRAASGEELEREVDAIARALDEHGATGRRDLARLVGARYWGPGRFGAALREAVEEGRVRRLSRTTYAPSSGA